MGAFLSPKSRETDATSTRGGEVEGLARVDDQPQWLQLPNGQVSVYPDTPAIELYTEHQLIKCETCLRVKPRMQTGQLEQYATFGRSASQSSAWHLRHPDAPRGTTIWKCVECSIAIDTEHRNFQEYILFHYGPQYTAIPEATSEFHWPREADRPSK